ncbi:GAF domain-containing protein [Cryobacterium serini]|uniref:GAF domain-containing protein n=1 Tax=Cryobacterium serini TaxID=1259201 RepID=A0A4R9BQB9_9MICO|nr:GAF domain-containing protein [Cryobacterium serini]TFD88927.1 GAF domain-containing protein [Cryobacterium serini]
MLVGEYDVLDLFRTLVDQCVVLLDASAAGILLADPHDNLQVLASTSEESHIVEVLHREAGEGPCLDAYRSGNVVTLSDIEAEEDQYPDFRIAALSHGFHSIHAIPTRFRPRTIGQALADVATISLLHERECWTAGDRGAQIGRSLSIRLDPGKPEAGVHHGQPQVCRFVGGEILWIAQSRA